MEPNDVNYPPDRSGECDRCHAEQVPVWEDATHPGHYQYCERCYRALAQRERKQRALFDLAG